MVFVMDSFSAVSAYIENLCYLMLPLLFPPNVLWLALKLQQSPAVVPDF